ncbi:uncharacterized protein LOC113401300 [Vanessa tameamea]|uniref:Uncharacterized protein LOC113401300 n=1 Tax=Vanessa tameamea TaxID=334116 RepID=A0ABM4AJM1_VANTA
MCKCVDLNNVLDRNCNYSVSKEIQYSRKNRKVSVTPSCFSICKIGAGDSAINRHSLDSKIQAKCMEKNTGNGGGDTVLLKCTQRKPTYSLLSVYFSNNHLVAIIKSVTKILLLSFAIIAWSPCIISVYIYWLITYPLRPQHIFTQSKYDECAKCKSCFQCGNAFWYSIFHSIVRALEKLGHAYNILVSSIKNKKHENKNRIGPFLPQSTVINKCLRHKHRKLHFNANPRERYTLSYMQRRGWIIKPSRKHRKRKHYLHKYYPIDNIDKSCVAAKNKQYPEVFGINTPGTLPSLKYLSCIRLSKKGHKENKSKKNFKNYSSKVVSTKSCPVLIKTSTSRTEKPNKQCLYCPKTSFVIPPEQRKRTKSVLLTRDSFRKLKHINQSKSVTTKQKVFRYFKTALKNIKSVARETDTKAWQNDDICKDIYVSNLRTKPWFWVYKLCPSFYPYFLVFIRFNENCAHCFLLMVSSCIWFPIICCCYLYCSLISECI